MIIWLILLAPLIVSLIISRTFLQQLYVGGLILINGLLIYELIKNTGEDLKLIVFIFISNLFIMLCATLICIKINGNKIKKGSENTKINKLEIRRSNEFSALIMSAASNIFLLVAVGGIEGLLKSWIDVADALTQNSFYRILSMLCYIIALANIIGAKEAGAKVNKIVLPIILLIIFALSVRVKILIIPVVFVLFASGGFKKLPYITAFWIGLLAVISYMLLMFSRWIGSIERISFEHIASVFSSVVEAGFERELFDQFFSVMKYYEIYGPDYGSTFRRIVFLPVDWIFGTNYAPGNPMYKYYAIQTGETGTGGSAHPTIYADSYAEYGYLGLVVPGLYYIFFSKIKNIFKNEISKNIIMAISFISIPLLIRGSVYYAVTYFMMSIIVGAIFAVISKIKIVS